MPTVTLSDGRELEFPDGMTPDAMKAAILKLPGATPPAGGTVMSAVGNLGRGFNDSLAETLGAPVDLIGKGARAIGLPIPEDAVGGSQSIKRLIRGVTDVAGVPAQDTTLDRAAYGAGRGVADAATIALPAAGVARAARAGSVTQGVANTLAAQPVAQIASGAVGGAVGEATDNPLLGAGAALAVPLAAAGARRAVTPFRSQLTPEQARLAAAAQREGIPLTPGQKTGSAPLQTMESAFTQLPFTSGVQNEIRDTQQRAFNRAVLQRAGVDADRATIDTLNDARNRLGGAIGDIANRNTLDASPIGFLDELVAASNNARRYAASDVERATINRIDDILGKVEAGDTIPGRAYRELDSAIGRSIRGTQNGDLRTHLSEVRNILRAQMDASISPADAAEWQNLRRHYANLMTIAATMKPGAAGSAKGDISPRGLAGALNQSTGGGYVWGRGDLNELSRIGREFVSEQVPDSGTARRTAMMNLLSGGGLGTAGALAGGIPGAAAGLLAPRAAQMIYNHPAVQAYLTNQVVPGGVNRGLLGAVAAAQGVGQTRGLLNQGLLNP